jgi:hypothetical protein
MNLRRTWPVAAGLVVSCASVDPGVPPEGPPPPTPSAVVFAPATASYLSTTHRLVERDVQGRTRSDSILLRFRVSTVISDVDSALAISFVIDSVLAATAQNILPREMAAASGATFTAQLSETGRMEGFAGGDTQSPLQQDIASRTASFFPTLPAGGMVPGATWVDTSEVQRDQAGARLTINAVVVYRSGEWEDWASGNEALPVEWDRVYSLGGTGEQFGQPFTLQGEGTASGSALFGSDGRFLGSVSREELVAQLSIDALGIVTPVRQLQSDTVRILQ